MINIPWTIISPVVWTVETRQAGPRDSCCLQILTLASVASVKIQIHQTQVVSRWVCVFAPSHFCSWLTRVEPDVVSAVVDHPPQGWIRSIWDSAEWLSNTPFPPKWTERYCLAAASAGSTGEHSNTQTHKTHKHCVIGHICKLRLGNNIIWSSPTQMFCTQSGEVWSNHKWSW